jgi:hypothetical protein
VVSSKSETNLTEKLEESNLGSLRACLVEGDPAQITRNRRLRRRSLLLSVVLQFAVLTVLVLVPLLSKTEPLPVGIIMPMPPYHRPASAVANNHSHPAPPKRGLSFCLTCPPVIPPRNTNTSERTIQEPTGVGDPVDLSPECPGCIPLDSARPQPAIPRAATPSIVHVTHIDPALLTHRIEPVYPALAIWPSRRVTKAPLNCTPSSPTTARFVRFRFWRATHFSINRLWMQSDSGDTNLLF